MQLPLCQPIRAHMHSGRILYIEVIQEEVDRYSIAMTGCAFPYGTVFRTAEEAVAAAAHALNALFVNDAPIDKFSTHEKPEFLDEEQLGRNCLP